jgi:nitrogen fixation NifU-like protein
MKNQSSPEIISPVSQTNGMQEMLSNAGYSDRAIQYYMEKPYMGRLLNADQVSEMTGTCGDTMAVYLKVADDVIADVRYEVMGCAGAISAAMAAVDLVKGKQIGEARSLEDGDVFRVLQEIPVKKHHCIQLAVKALHKTIDEYQQKN